MAAAEQTSSNNYNKKKSNSATKIAYIAILLFVVYGYQKLNSKTDVSAATSNVATQIINKPITTQPISTTTFSCDGRQYCSQMTTRAEAVYSMRNCPETKWMETVTVFLAKTTLDFDY